MVVPHREISWPNTPERANAAEQCGLLLPVLQLFSAPPAGCLPVYWVALTLSSALDCYKYIAEVAPLITPANYRLLLASAPGPSPCSDRLPRIEDFLSIDDFKMRH
jgi:hypothetical protein